MLKITSAKDAAGELFDSGVRSWHEGLTDLQRAQLRAIEATKNLESYGSQKEDSITRQQYGQTSGIANHGMGADGGQVKTTTPQSDPAGMSDEELQAAIAALQGQQAPAVQPQVAYWQGGYHTPAQPQGNDATQTRPDYGTVQQRPAYNFTPQQASQPMSVQAAQVQNMNNQAQSTEWKQRLNGLLDMPGFTMPGLLQ